MEELLITIKKNNLTKKDLLLEAQCVEDYGEWMHMCLLGFSADMLRQAVKLI